MTMRITGLMVLVATSLLASNAAAALHPRIIGGSPSLDGEFPFMAALTYASTLGPVYQSDYQAQFCGATVIAERWLLTAAHCVQHLAVDELEVITGVTTLADSPPYATRTGVIGVVQHPRYDSDELANDVALVYLAAPVSPDPSFGRDDGSLLGALNEGDDLLVIGWGVTDQGNVGDTDDDLFSATLQKAVLDYIPETRCNSSAFYAGAICAGFSGGTPRDTCLGDSGGPLLRAVGGGHWTQVGITSYGASETCATQAEPGVYMSVAYYATFIDGAQTHPDLQVSASKVYDSLAGALPRTRIVVRNASPAHDAANVVITVHVDGDVATVEDSDFAGCTSLITGSGSSSSRRTYTCTKGTLPAAGVDSRDLVLTFQGTGPRLVTASVATTSGDYFADNNTAILDHAAPVIHRRARGGAPSPLTMLVVFFIAFRRHAPNHPLRLRQLLRLGRDA